MTADYLQIKRQVVANDHRWFEAHPHATRRLRPPVTGEFGSCPMSADGFVIVEQVAPGIRMRQHYGPSRGTDDAVFLVDEATGEVVQSYDQAVWQ